MTIRKTDTVWFSPVRVYKHIDRLTKKVGAEAIEKESKFKRVREIRLAAVAALLIYKRTGNPAYVQLCKDDPPDAYIMQESKTIIGQLDITTLEISTFLGNTSETFLDQLKRKAPATFHKYSDEYVIVYELKTYNRVNFDEAREYLNKVKTPFPVWTLLGKNVNGDTIAEFTTINPDTYSSEVNIGETAFQFDSIGIPDVLFIKRAGSVKSVRKEPSGLYNKPPWDEDIEK